MSNEPTVISINDIRRLALKEFKASRTEMQRCPDQLVPSVVIVTGKSFTDKTTWHNDYLSFPVFDKNRYKLLKLIAQEYARKPDYLIAIVLCTEVWVSTVRKEEFEKSEARIEPRLDPNHTEMLMVSALTLDQQMVFVRAQFERKKGKPIFEPTQIGEENMMDYKNVILNHFLASYAEEVMRLKKQN